MGARSEPEPTTFTTLAVYKRKKNDRAYGSQGNVWDRYGDSSSATSVEESVRRGSQGRREHQRRDWPPHGHRQLTSPQGQSPPVRWPQPTEARGQAGSKRFMQACQIARMRLGHLHGKLSLQAPLPSKRSGAQHQALDGADLLHGLPLLHQIWLDITIPPIVSGTSAGSGTRQDGLVNPFIGPSQSVRSQRTDPEDDWRPDAATPARSTSKTLDPARDGKFWSDYGQSSGESSAAASAMHRQPWRPREDARRGYSSAARDPSEGSIAGPALTSNDEMSDLDEELLRKIADRVTRR